MVYRRRRNTGVHPSARQSMSDIPHHQNSTTSQVTKSFHLTIQPPSARKTGYIVLKKRPQGFLILKNIFLSFSNSVLLFSLHNAGRRCAWHTAGHGTPRFPRPPNHGQGRKRHRPPPRFRVTTSHQVFPPRTTTAKLPQILLQSVQEKCNRCFLSLIYIFQGSVHFASRLCGCGVDEMAGDCTTDGTTREDSNSTT